MFFPTVFMFHLFTVQAGIVCACALMLAACSKQEATEFTQQAQASLSTNEQKARDAEPQPALAEQSYEEGRHYFRVGRPTRNANGRVEVAEVFWFGCPHCFAMESYVESWKKSKSDDTELVLIAAPLSGIWGFHAQVYYTNKAMGIAEQVHMATFNAIHRQNKRLSSLDEVADFYQKNFGVDAEDYRDTFNSFSVNVEMKKASELLQRYEINSVPNFVVGEAFRVNAESAGSTPGIFHVIDYLVRTQF